MSKTTINIDNSTVIRVLFLIFGGVLVFMFLSRIIEPLIMILISAFLAIGLSPAVSWIANKLRIKSRAAATGLAYIFVVAFLATFFTLVFPPIIKQTIDFVKQVPQSVQDLRDNNQSVNNFIEKYNIESEIDKYTSNFGSKITEYSSSALSTAGKVGATLAKTVMVLVITFMMLVEGPTWIKKYFDSLKKEKRSRQQYLARKMHRVVVGYFNGQVLIAAVGGLFATLGIFIIGHIMGVSVNAIALGGIVALFALLPLIGTTIGAAIAVLTIAISSIPMAIVMIIYFIIYQQIENATIQPLIQSKNSSITPLTVFIAALLGVGLGGLLGALLAIPAAGCVKVYLDDYFARRASGTKQLAEAKVK